MSYTDLWETNFNFYKSSDPGWSFNFYKSSDPSWKGVVKPAVQFVLEPIRSDLIKYARKQATKYLIDNARMPRMQPGELMDVDHEPRRRVPMRRPAQRKTPGTKGEYTGRIRFPRKKPKVDRTPMAIKGSRGKIEQTIQGVDGTNVSYLGFTSMIRNVVNGGGVSNCIYGAAPFHVAMSLLRMLLKREYKADIEHPSQKFGDIYMNSVVGGAFTNNVLSGGTNAQPQPKYLHFVRKVTPLSASSTGATVKPYYEIVWGKLFDTTMTMASIAADIAANVLLSSNFGASNNGAAVATVGGVQCPVMYELHGAFFHDGDANATGSTIDVQKALHYLGDYTIAVNTLTTIYFQNQTTSDSGGATGNNYDVVDANPVNGRIYYFSHPNPVIRSYPSSVDDKSWKLMHDANADGIIYPDTNQIGTAGEAGLPTGSAFNQLPDSSMFENLKSYDNISLAPGEMKRFDLKFKFVGNINKFITGLRLIYPGTSTFNVSTLNPSNAQYQINKDSKALGTSVLFAFEKRLSSGAGNPIITYQRNTYTSAMWLKNKKKSMMPVCIGEVAPLPDDTTTNP